jgi:hypothetical protein
MDYYGDKLVELLGLPEDNDEIIKMRKAYNAPKPLLDSFFKEYGGTSIYIDEHKLELFFSDSSFFDGTDSGIYGNNDLLFSGIVFRQGTDVAFPFGLTPQDALVDVYQKLDRQEDYDDTDMVPQKIWEFTTKNGMRALLYVIFDSGKYEKVAIVKVYLFDSEDEEVLEDIKVVH